MLRMIAESSGLRKMSKITEPIEKIIRKIIDGTMGNGLMQEENTVGGERYITEGMPEMMRACGEEAIVLLENDGTLPLKKEESVAVFGRVQKDWFYVGYGSGGDVHPPYEVSLFEGLKNQGISFDEELQKIYEDWCNEPEHVADHGWWGHWPYFHPEMSLEESVVKKAAGKNDVAIIVIGRAAGEDRENVLEPGSYYLTDIEKDMLQKVTTCFEKTILIMDCGSIMDLSFVEEYNISAVVFAWQLGQESGNAIASVLSGETNPSGKLVDTIAKKYEDYPSAAYFGGKEFNNYNEDIFVGYRYFETFAKDKVLYPFGFGLSYTSFDIMPISLVYNENTTNITVKVKNTGLVSGKEVVQVYCSQPEGVLRKAERVLVAFDKTKVLLPGEEEILEFSIEDKMLASFDDEGDTGFSYAFVLEAGQYDFYVGNSVRGDINCGQVQINETHLVEQCQSACSIASKIDLKERILEDLPKEIPFSGNKGILLSDVKSGKHTMEEFVAQLSDKELADLTRGEGSMNSPLGVSGNAGAFGGITEDLRSKGIPAIITADGPAGLRIKRYTSLLPCGTAIACTWNTKLVESMFEKEGEETVHFNVDVILSPGMNIHRNPLCGRNFEYYSEDPIISGKMAAAAVRGIQKGGASACPKHFACNNQEYNRNQNDSRVSERALREIYLRNFEICVKEANPQNIMTSYNKINGVWSHYNYDLVTTVLRKEWGFKGNIVTDWWMRKSSSPEFPQLKDNAYRVRAQVDVLMPGNMSFTKKGYVYDKKQLKTLGKKNGLTRGELQRSAENVLRFALTRI